MMDEWIYGWMVGWMDDGQMAHPDGQMAHKLWTSKRGWQSVLLEDEWIDRQMEKQTAD